MFIQQTSNWRSCDQSTLQITNIPFLFPYFSYYPVISLVTSLPLISFNHVFFGSSHIINTAITKSMLSMNDIDKEQRNLQKEKLKQLYQFCDDYSKIAFDERDFGSLVSGNSVNGERQEQLKESENSSLQISLSSVSDSPSIDNSRCIILNPAKVQLGLPLQSIYSLYLTLNESNPTEKEISNIQNVINMEVEKMRIERNQQNENRTI
ncbi:hypothetical protein PRIPAC_80268 [Pristionchus pacificus]|nr:hypothetical protein PRIPAC_80268 [Pristionchus pacificus]